MKKGQAAMEFLMTYGWGILVVIIAIGALAYFGVLNPSRFLPNSCVMFPGIACIDNIVTPNSITLVLQNGFGKDITVQSLDVTDDADGSNCPLSVTNLVVEDGSTKYLSVGQCQNGAVSRRFRGTIDIVYTVDSLSHNYKGTIVTQVEDIANVNCIGGTCTATPIFSYEEDGNPYWGPILLNTNDGNAINIVDEPIQNPDYVIIGFPPLGFADTATVSSATLQFRHQENLPVGCSTLSDPNRHRVYCYDGSSWTSSPSVYVYPESSVYFTEPAFSIGACVLDGFDANNVVIKITFDPTDAGSGVCGNMDIDSAQISVTSP